MTNRNFPENSFISLI